MATAHALAAIPDLRTEIKEAEGLVGALHKERRRQRSADKDVVECSRATGRCHESLKFLHNAMKNREISPDTVNRKFSVPYCTKSLNDLRAAMTAKGKPTYKRHTAAMDKIYREVVVLLIDDNQWLPKRDPERLEPVLKTEPECRLWWRGSFGQKLKVPWDEFWCHLAPYLQNVYGVGPGEQKSSDPKEPKSDDDSDGESDDEGLYDFSCFEKAIKAVIDLEPARAKWINDVVKNKDPRLSEEISRAKAERDYDKLTVEVSMKGFKKFYWRFGPWHDLFKKSVTLCDIHGKLLEWVFPTTAVLDGLPFLEAGKSKSNIFFLRYSKQDGCLARQALHSKQLIMNGEDGYYAQHEQGSRHLPPSKHYAHIPEFLDDFTSSKFDDHSVGHWEEALMSCDALADSKGYKVLGPIPKSEASTTEIAKRVHSVKRHVEDVKQIGLQIVTNLDSATPRLFLVIPEDLQLNDKGKFNIFDEGKKPKENSKEKSGVLSKMKAKIVGVLQSKWRVFVLCEGYIERNGKTHYEFHLTDHEGFPITLGRRKLISALPYIRVGLKVVAGLCSQASGIPFGDGGAVADCFDKLAGSKKVGGVDKFELLEKKLKDAQHLLTGKESDLPENKITVMENYKALRALLDEHLPEENLNQGRCAKLQLMVNKDVQKVWVCKDHEDGLVGIVDEVHHDLDRPLRGLPGAKGSRHDVGSSSARGGGPILPLKNGNLEVSCVLIPNLKKRVDVRCSVTPVDTHDARLEELGMTIAHKHPSSVLPLKWKPKIAIDSVGIQVKDLKGVLLAKRVFHVGTGTFAHDLQLKTKSGADAGDIHVDIKYTHL